AAMNGLVLVDGTTGAVDGDAATTPVGDGATPTKTGDAGAASLAALALLSAGAVIVLKKKR
ncbi:MAG: LPXTG cell wall anchor domain-containing protein, partial [Clostridium sp.]